VDTSLSHAKQKKGEGNGGRGTEDEGVSIIVLSRIPQEAVMLAWRLAECPGGNV
jgi:hypothetical protein